MRSTMAISLLAAMLASQALANDSTAELATGGLVLVESPNIEMRSEDLFISTSEVRVRYEFFNASANDVSTLVAFPMPDITIKEPDDNVSVPTEDPENLLGFTTWADGHPVTASVEQKVFARGVERTDVLRALKIPLAPHLQTTRDALDRLPKAEWSKLVDLGLAEVDEYDIGQGMKKHLEPRWTLKTTYYWKQTFAARRMTTIEHRYKPSVGRSVETSLGSPGSAREDWFRTYKQHYCLDQDFLAAVERARATANRKAGSPLSESRIAYILKTGANWSGPIKEFRLVVDKGAAANLVSFCGEGVTKVAPTRFEMRKTDFTPKSDLYVLILERLSN